MRFFESLSLELVSLNRSNIFLQAAGLAELRRSTGWCIAWQGLACTFFKRSFTISYSYLSASIGSSVAALIAGNIPLTIPTKPKIAVDQIRMAELIFR